VVPKLLEVSELEETNLSSRSSKSGCTVEKALLHGAENLWELYQL